VLSQPEVYARLRDHFIALRMDWEQGNHFKDRFGFILGTGDQMILAPGGEPIPPASLGRNARSEGDGHTGVIFGRHGVDPTPAILDAVIARHPKKNDALRIDWFLWTEHPARRKGGKYPPGVESIAAFARLPIAEIHGPIPAALRNDDFLRQHVRQFIWASAAPRPPGENAIRENGPNGNRLTLRRIQDGLPAGRPLLLAQLNADELSPQKFGSVLDSAWLDYMKDRPLVARGYLENEHGNWMRGRRDQMITEDEESRRQARQGILRPPGR
jgi:hypothetical protein